ncbi:hypothetical protein AAC387_Pa05g0467 [Persea americana]
MAFKVKYLIASWVSVLPNFRGYSIDDVGGVHISHSSLGLLYLEAPPLGTLKLNFDRSAIGNLGQSGIGGVFRDIAGVKLVSFWGPLGFKIVNEVEMIALRTGLREVDKMSFRKFIVKEGTLYVP